MSDQAFIVGIRNHIIKDEIKIAMGKMRVLLENTPQLNEILLQSGRFESIRQQIRIGTVSWEQGSVEQNRIRAALLELLPEIALHGEKPEIQEELLHAISIVNSKNILTNSNINAGGNVHIGDVVYQNTPGPTVQVLAHPLNDHLTGALLKVIAPYSTSATRFLEKVQTRPDWIAYPEANNKAKEILAYSFVGVLGIHLSKLFAIGREPFTDQIRDKYIEKCLHIARRSLDLIVFALMSQLWEEQRTKARVFTAVQTKALTDFFDRPFEPTIKERVTFFQLLHTLFMEHQLSFPLPELSDFAPNFQAESPFYAACLDLSELNSKLDKQKCTTEDCVKAELGLMACISAFPFLSACKMASIKRIGYWQIRTDMPRYLHRYASLGIDNKANVDAEKIDFTADAAHTDAVLLYRGDRYQTGINLSPFVIDYNALTVENGAKICFYRTRAMVDESLDFCFLEDNSCINIPWKGIMTPNSNANEVLFLPENSKAYNLDNVVAQFLAARKCILGDDLNFDNL